MLYIIRGLPGSGKSTMAKKLVDDGICDHHYEADQFFMVDGEYRFDATKLGLAHSNCLNQTEAALFSGLDVVVSNTFTTYKEIAPYLRYADSIDAPFVIYTMTENYGSIHNVPEEAMNRMRERWMTTDQIMELFEKEVDIKPKSSGIIQLPI